MKTIRPAVTLLLLCVTVTTVPGAKQLKPYETLRSGRQALRAGDPDKAMERFAAVLGQFAGTPEAAQAAIEMGRVYEANGSLASAEASYDHARKAGSLRWAAEGTLALAELRLKQGKSQEAARLARTVADKHAGQPLEGQAWVVLGGAAAADGDRERAQALIDQAVERYPDERWVPAALLTACRIWDAASAHTRAELAVARLMINHPRTIEAMEARYLRATPGPERTGPASDFRPRAEQIRDLEWLVVLSPDRDLVARAIWDLSRCHAAASRSGHSSRYAAEAELILRRYFDWDWPEFEPWRPKARLRLADLLRRRGCDQEAEKELRALVERYPDLPEAAQARSLLTAIQPQWVDAAEALRGTGAQFIWKNHSEFAEIRFQETYDRHAPGFAKHEKAQRTVRIGLRIGMPFAVLWHRQVGIGWGPRVQAGRYLVSRAHLATLLARYKIRPADTPGVHTAPSPAEGLLARAHEIRDRDPHGAFRLYDRIIRQHPGTIEAVHARFDIALHKYEKAGKLDEARRRYQQVIAELPRSDWAAWARIKIAEMDARADHVPQALDSLNRVALDFADTPLQADALMAQARIQSNQRDHPAAQRICAYIADQFAGWPIATEALQLAGYSGLWSEQSLEAFGFFQRIIAEYPFSVQAPDAVYYCCWHPREHLRQERDKHWVVAYDPDPDRYQRILPLSLSGRNDNWEFFLSAKRSLETPVPKGGGHWRGYAAGSVARFYSGERHFDSMLDTINRALDGPEDTGDSSRQDLRRMKDQVMPQRDLIPLDRKATEDGPAGRLMWDGHSDDAVFVAADGTRLHLREGDDFAWSGMEIGVRWRVRVDEGHFMVSRSGLVEALDRARARARSET